MIILITGGSLLAVAFGLAIVTDLRRRRSRSLEGQPDLQKAKSFTHIQPGARYVAGVFRPPDDIDDGRPF
jgi:hypothetical protein